MIQVDQRAQMMHSMGERRLWATVLEEAAYRATYVGEGSAIAFFRQCGGHFTMLCSLMNLPEDSIRQHVVRKALTKLQQKTDKGNTNGQLDLEPFSNHG